MWVIGTGRWETLRFRPQCVDRNIGGESMVVDGTCVGRGWRNVAPRFAHATLSACAMVSGHRHVDMLGDDRRNHAYRSAVVKWLQQCAQTHETQGDESRRTAVRVLDIGCGSGLLASMVANEYAKRPDLSELFDLEVYACEVRA